jgi:hypothetical protein
LIPFWALLSPTHAVVEIKNVCLDLIAGVVAWEMRHFQHVKNVAGIPVAPVDELMQNVVEI